VTLPCQDQDIPILWRTLHRYDSTRGYEIACGTLFAALGLTPGESAPPVQPAPPAYNAPPDRFPPRLAELGYRVTFLNGAEGIQIDIGAAQPDYWNLAQLIHSTVRESLVLRLPRFFGPLQESLRHSEGVPKRVPQFPVELDALFLGLDHRC